MGEIVEEIFHQLMKYWHVDLNQKKGYSQREVKCTASLKGLYHSRTDYNRVDQDQA